MLILQKLKDKGPATILPLACACFVIYLGYHGLYGDRGLVKFMDLNHDIERSEYALAALRKERQILHIRTRHLRPETLDRDLLDERARALLSYAMPDEIVIFDPADSLIGNN